MSSFETLGPYKIGDLLGRGGMGSVYVGTHMKTGDRVAVKLIATQYADDMRFRRRFVSEIETLMRLRHENIVRILGCGEEADHLFYSMELFQGETLRQKIRRAKRLDWKTTIDISIQIATALKHAHDIGVLHRDLKPANIFLVPGIESEPEQVKIVDFGIVKMFPIDWAGSENLEQQFDPDGRLDSGSPTADGSILGTADYMAPEQAGTGPITPRTDLYALGSLIYAMLVGRPPFTGKNVTEVIDSLKRERPIPLQMINPEFPADLTQLVNDLLEKSPEDRPKTALAVQKRLKAMRVGLERQATLVATDGDTNVTDSGTDATPPPQGPSPSEPPSTAQPATLGGATVDLHPNHKQDIQEHDASDEFDIATPLPRGKSHFKAIDQEELETQLLTRDDDRNQWWIQILSVSGMVAILGVGAYLFYQAMKTPPADVLYERIVIAEADDDLLSAEQSMEQFASEYPNDERADQVHELIDRLESERYMRRLRHRAGKTGGIEQLPPAELAFYEAMLQRDTDPEDARNRLQAWMDVFSDGPDATDRSRRLMTTAAKDELARINTMLKNLGPDQRLIDLQKRIEWAQSNLAPKKQQQLYRGIIGLYESKPWAEPAIKKATALLEIEAEKKEE